MSSDNAESSSILQQLQNAISENRRETNQHSRILDAVQDSIVALDNSQKDVVNIKKLIKNIVDRLQRIEIAIEKPTQPSSKPKSLSVKSIPIPTYSGKSEEKNSSSVRSFLYSVTKAGKMYGFDEDSMLQLADCHFQGRAAQWILKLERQEKKPTTMAELKSVMFKAFVPSDEKSRARNKLMDLEWKPSVTLEHHITVFEELTELCDTPRNEAYGYFFRSLPPFYKSELQKKFPEGTPPAGESDLDCVFEFVRNVDIARSLNAYARGNKSKRAENNYNASTPTTSSTLKDDSLDSWGPAQKEERSAYTKAKRCWKCGKKGYDEPDHPCRKRRASGTTNNLKE